MDRTAEVNAIRELAGNICATLNDYPDLIAAIHEEIGTTGTNSQYVKRGLDANTGEYNANECLAHDLVDYALSTEGRESWGIDIEMDDHDQRLLVQFIQSNLND